MEKINILLIDNAITLDDDLKEILQDNNFNVYSVKLPLEDKTLLEGFRPDLILCRDPENRLNISSKSKIIREININLNIPIVLFSPIGASSSYLDELEADFFCHISTPCTEKYLVTTLNKVMADKNKIIPPEKKHTLKINYNERDYNLNISEERLVSFFISIMENASEQNMILSNILHKNCRIKKLDSSGEVIGQEFSCSENDSGYGYRIYRAFEKGEFCLYYQPVISLAEGSVSGFETLIRWIDPERGIIPPSEFIPVIESSQLIVPLGYWIVTEASAQMKQWQEKFNFGNPPRMNINLSPRQFAQRELCSRITEIIQRNGMPADQFAFEITESAILDDVETANLTMLQFKSNNYSLYMDDFGTGYSSLSYLLYYPIDVIKIDKSFVQWMHIDEQSEEIVKSVIELAHNLKKQVVAEGVETEEHYTSLREMGCDYGQGFFFAHPMPGEEATKYLESKISGKTGSINHS
jgi:EAL domain-containing protein (putative c-di-GMP-specific phosphodiesterase class I)/DNA-binding response OmpR family regulator